MSILPTYADLLGTHLPEVSGWNFGRNKDWAMVVPTTRDPDPQTGWRLRATVVQEDLPKAWDLLRQILVKYSLPARVALPATAEALVDPLVPGAGALIIITADRRTDRPDGDVMWWQDVVDDIEATWEDQGIGRGLPVVSDRPLPGTGYLSVRCDAGMLGDVERHLDYNLACQPGPFWPIEGRSETISEPATLLEAVMGPSSADWTHTGGFWRLSAGVRELLPLKQAALQLELPLKLWQKGREWTVGWPDTADMVLSERWHEWREHTDAWRVAHVLQRPDFVVLPRRSDAMPPAIVVPPLTPADQSALVGVLARGGLSVVQRGGGPLEIPIPGRALADAFVGEHSGTTDGEERLPLSIPAECIDAPEDPNRPAPARVFVPRRRPQQAHEVAAIARAAATSRHRRDPAAQKHKESIDRLKRAGVVKVSERKGLDRILMQREREVGAPFAEDSKELLRDMVGMLDAVSKLGPSAISSQQRAIVRGSAMGLERLHARPDLSMGRAYEAIKKGNTVVEGTIRHLREGTDVDGRAMADSLSDLSGRVQARMMTGAPKVRLALTPEEIAKMRKGAALRT